MHQEASTYDRPASGLNGSPHKSPAIRLPHDHLDQAVATHMRRDITTVRQEQTVGDVLAGLRRQPLGDKIVYIYVLDADDRLVGVLPTRHLLSSDVEQQISAIMIARVISLFYLSTVLEAVKLFMSSRLLALPIIDQERKLVGVVDIGLFTDEIVQVSERHSFEDVFQLIGVHLSSLQGKTAWSQFRARFPWLLCNILGGLACAVLSSQYEHLLNTAIVLALFIPVVLALAESVGMQSMTLTLQRLHSTPQTRSDLTRAIGREFLVALALGICCGLFVGCVAYVWKGPGPIAVAIGTSIAFAVLTACLLGVVLPTTVHALKVDPRIAAGPIVLAGADLATLLFYFNMALAIAT